MPSPKIRHAIKDVAIVVVGVITVWLVLQVIFGTQNPFYVVSSGSMEPVLNVYDVLIVKNGSTFENVKRGDIIVFNRPEVHDRVIVHRIVDIKGSNERILTTKGDANPTTIPGTDFPITKDDYIGEVVYVIPKIGYITRLIQPPVNYIIIAIILAILFFNRTSRTKDEKHDKESSSRRADTLSDTAEVHKDEAELPDTLSDTAEVHKDEAELPDTLSDTAEVHKDEAELPDTLSDTAEVHKDEAELPDTLSDTAEVHKDEAELPDTLSDTAEVHKDEAELPDTLSDTAEVHKDEAELPDTLSDVDIKNDKDSNSFTNNKSKKGQNE